MAPSQNDPFAWAQWAAQQDPGTYNLGSYSFADNPQQTAESAYLLKQAGLWRPEWDSWAAYMSNPVEGSDLPAERWAPFAEQPDFSSLAGYTLNNNRGPGNSAFLSVRRPDGQVAALDQYEQSGSWKGDDYRQMALATAAMLGGGMALNGGFGGLGAAGGSGGGFGTLGTIAPGSAALAPIGATGVGTLAPGYITAGLGELAAVGGGIGTLGAIAPGSSALAPIASGAALPVAEGSITAGLGALPAAPGLLAGTGAGSVASNLLTNPKAIGAIAGGLLGGSEGGSSGGGEAPYTGPMPTITRGGWNPNPQATMMQVPQFGQGLLTQGQPNAGLWRFKGQ